MKLEEILEIYDDLANDSFIADGYDDCIIGFSNENRIVYSVDKMVKTLINRDGMTHDEALEYIDFNTFGATQDKYPYPIYIWT